MSYAMFALLVACSGGGTHDAYTPVVTEVPCVVPSWKFLGDDATVPSREIAGPFVCGRALEIWFHDHGYERIVTIVPLEKPVDELIKRDRAAVPGTQALLVLHTRTGGPWPSAADLAVRSVASCKGAGAEQFGPQYCALGLNKTELLFGGIPPLFLVPITEYGEAVSNPGTGEILWVIRRRSTSSSISGSDRGAARRSSP